MIIRAEEQDGLWYIRTVDNDGATWFRRVYRTPIGALKAVQRLEQKGHVIRFASERATLEKATQEPSQ